MWRWWWRWRWELYLASFRIGGASGESGGDSMDQELERLDQALAALPTPPPSTVPAGVDPADAFALGGEAAPLPPPEVLGPTSSRRRPRRNCRPPA